MNVKELIEELKKYDEKIPVINANTLDDVKIYKSNYGESVLILIQ